MFDVVTVATLLGLAVVAAGGSVVSVTPVRVAGWLALVAVDESLIIAEREDSERVEVSWLGASVVSEVDVVVAKSVETSAKGLAAGEPDVARDVPGGEDVSATVSFSWTTWSTLVVDRDVSVVPDVSSTVWKEATVSLATASSTAAISTVGEEVEFGEPVMPSVNAFSDVSEGPNHVPVVPVRDTIVVLIIKLVSSPEAVSDTAAV